MFWLRYNGLPNMSGGAAAGTTQGDAKKILVVLLYMVLGQCSDST